MRSIAATRLTHWTVLLALFSASAVALGDDWPEFRGPTGQGLVEGGPWPVEWGANKNVVWKQPIPGRGWSSPVVAKGRLYLTTAVPMQGNDQSLRALCLDAKNGDILWNTEVLRQDGKTAPNIHRKNSHASPTPITDGERLYVHFGHHGTACLDLQGQVRWKNTENKYAPVHGNGGSPILVDDLLIFSGDGSDRQFIVALEKLTGKVRWRTDRKTTAFKKFSFSTPLAITVKGRKLIVSPGSDVVGAYDAASGKEVWRVRYDGYSVVPRPVFGHSLVFLAAGYEDPSLFAIKPDGEGDVTETHVVWSTDRNAPLNPSPLLVGEELYVVSDLGVASCFDAKTGKLHWRERLGGNYSSSPLHADGRVYFQNEEGTATVIRAGRRFERLAENKLDEQTLASYAAADRAFFIRTEKHLYRIEAR